MISAAALSFLILAAALGFPAHGSQAHGKFESRAVMHHSDILKPHSGTHRPADCCFSYTPRNIRCSFMTDYFETTSRCSKPGIIFLTKTRKRVCADPADKNVQNCKRQLQLALGKNYGWGETGRVVE